MRCDAMLVVRKAIFKWAEIRTGEQEEEEEEEEEEDGGRARAGVEVPPSEPFYQLGR